MGEMRHYTTPLINILIRHKQGRRLNKCIRSVHHQTYRNYNMFIHDDDGSNVFPYHYNLFCNELKAKVTDGWFFFLDDDDYLNTPDALEQIVPYLTNPNEAVICQMKRGDSKIKPSGGNIRNKEIISGKIGMPCLILHHTQKHIADISAEDNGDYLWIKDVSMKIPVKFVEKILVNSPKRNHGL